MGYKAKQRFKDGTKPVPAGGLNFSERSAGIYEIGEAYQGSNADAAKLVKQGLLEADRPAKAAQPPASNGANGNGASKSDASQGSQKAQGATGKAAAAKPKPKASSAQGGAKPKPKAASANASTPAQNLDSGA